MGLRRARDLVCAALVALLAVSCGFGAAAQPVERRIALVVGNAAYENVERLTNPINDARAMAQALRGVGFEVDELYDADARTLTRGIRDFGLKARQADVALFYYAGHGIQAQHENYLIPVDARLERDRDLLYEAVPLDLALGEIAQASKLGIVLLDACRNNPFVERLVRLAPAGSRGAVGSGLARVDSVPRDVVVAMSTRADEVAEDGAGEHSPFTAALLANFAKPGLELSLFFRSVRDAVLQTTGGRQEPYVFSSVGAEPFYFHPLPPRKPPVVESRRTVRMYTGRIGIAAPRDESGDPLTVVIKTLPRGLVRDGSRVLRPGDRLDPAALAELIYVPEPGFVGSAGFLTYQVEGSGGVAESAVEITVMDAAEAAAEMAEAALWDRIRTSTRPDDFDLFLRVYPNSRFAPLAAQRRDQLATTPSAGVAPTQEAALAGGSRGMAPPHEDKTFRDCATCPVMIRVPGGSFTIGQGATEAAARPAQRVTVRSFALGQEPITNGQWRACETDGGCTPIPQAATAEDDAPVHNTSWDDAQQYVTWLSKLSGRAYRLPSEAEWEYAARAGTTTPYFWGSAVGVGHADCADCGGEHNPRGPLPAGRFPPNGFGLLGMAGGVTQWMADCWVPNYEGLAANGAPRTAPSCSQRVLRGGSYLSPHDKITPVIRNRYDAPVRYPSHGFRVARDLDGG